MPYALSIKTPFLSEKSLSCGRTCLCSPTSDVAFGTTLNSTPIAISNPLMATPTICLSTLPASISTLPSSLKGGCMIVDSTRRGKRFPDSMSKTIPIWTCVLNRAIYGYRHRASVDCNCSSDIESATSNAHDSREQFLSDWDCSLHLPLWVSESEKAMIEKRLEGWTKELEASGADIASLALSLRKPLRSLWISQRTVIWLNEVPEYDSWDFTPVILVSASSSDGTFQHRTTSEFSWNYIAGAGDDEESWARGLSPHLFWKHAYDIISSGPELCNQKTVNIVEKDRVSRARRGENAPQVSVKPSKIPGNTSSYQFGDPLVFDDEFVAEGDKRSDDCCMYFLGSTGIAVGKSRLAIETAPAFCILNCDRESLPVSLENLEMYMHLPIVDSKIDRFSLLRNLPSAINFAKSQLQKKKTLLICCSNGEDISICVSLAILTSLYDEAGHFDEGRSFNETQITKMELRRRLVFICKYVVNARPSRGNIKQVFAFLSGGCNKPFA